MSDIFVNVLPIFLITMLGSIIKREWISSEEFWRNLEKLLYFLLFPLVLFNKISSSDIRAHDLSGLVFALMISTMIIVIGLIIFQKKKSIDKVVFTSLFQGSTRYNSYIFLGVGNALFADRGMEIIAIIAVYMIVFTNIISVLIFHLYIPDESCSKSTLNIRPLFKNFASNPLIIASLIGLSFQYFDIHLNVGLKNTLDLLSNAALTVGVMNVGARLKFHVNEKHVHVILMATCIKLFIFPMIAVTVLWSLGITGDIKAIGILYSCLPPASTSYLLSKQLRGDPESMASIITFSTIFSVFSLSFLLYVMT